MKTPFYRYACMGILSVSALGIASGVRAQSGNNSVDDADWQQPVATVGGGCPIESPNGMALYTASGSAGTLDIWVYRMDHRTGEFSDRTRLEAPVSLDDANDFCPTPLDGNGLMFVSNRIGDSSCGSTDIYITRHNAFPEKSLSDAIVLGCAPDGPNTTGTEFSPALIKTKNGTFLYYSSDVDGDQDIYVSEQMQDGSFSQGIPVAGVNTDADDRQPNLSEDGLIMVFASNRDDADYGGGFDIFITRRDNLASPWHAPRNLSWDLVFATQPLDETRPSLSRALERLYYGANGTVYQSTRQ